MGRTTPATVNAEGGILAGVSLADAAQAYAALGWRIFPVQPRGKAPRFARAHDDRDVQHACPGGHVCGSLGHGFKDATADVDRVARWWTRWPDSNIGVATGNPRAAVVGTAGASPDVLDVDVKNGAPGRASFERLTTVGLIRGAWGGAVTPSGGWHYFYDGTVQASATLKKAGIDFRACGGYVVAPPSVVSLRTVVQRLDGTSAVQRVERPYEWTHLDFSQEGRLSWAEVRDFLNPPPPPRDLSSYSALADNASPIIAWFAQQPAGSRNDSLFWAACRILESGYGDERLDDLAAEAHLSGLERGEVAKTLRSARARVLGGGA